MKKKKYRSMGLLLFFFFISIVFSFLCSLLEAVLLSITPSYITRLEQEGKFAGHILKRYKEDIDRPLSAILTLNTAAHTIGAVGVGAQAGALWGKHYLSLATIQISYEAIVAGAMTIAILILSEIIPKTIGANNWKRLATFTVNTLQIMLWVLHPLVWLSQFITRNLKNKELRSVLSRADFAAMAQEGEETGALRKDESDLIRNMLNFSRLRVRDIMTPRTVVVLADARLSLADYHQANQPHPFSRIPVYEGNQDNITGILLKDDLLEKIAEGKGTLPIGEISQAVQFVHESVYLQAFFESLIRQRNHLSVVIDEFGSMVGVASMEDVFETLIGKEIVDEKDVVEDMQQLARDQWAERRKQQGP